LAAAWRMVWINLVLALCVCVGGGGVGGEGGRGKRKGGKFGRCLVQEGD
jgi:hypothetical protein